MICFVFACDFFFDILLCARSIVWWQHRLLISDYSSHHERISQNKQTEKVNINASKENKETHKEKWPFSLYHTNQWRMTLESVTITTCCFQFMLQTLGNNEHSSNVNYTLLFKSIFPIFIGWVFIDCSCYCCCCCCCSCYCNVAIDVAVAVAVAVLL